VSARRLAAAASLAVALHAGAAAPRAKAPVAVPVPVPAVAPASRAGDPVAGRAKADDERCTECHSPHDPATAQPGDGLHALLEGQPLGYLAKQMRDFRAGARTHAVMTLVARNLEDADTADILAWFAAAPQRPPAAATGAADAAAQRLYAQGDPARQLAACASCHGPEGAPPVTPDTPRIAGQDPAYLRAQLLAWRDGERRNSASGLMNAALHGLSDAELEALARTLAAMK
jgi:cytochrome c553